MQSLIELGEALRIVYTEDGDLDGRTGKENYD